MSIQEALFQHGELAEQPDPLIQQACDIYNEVAATVGWPKAIKLLTKRRKALARAIQDAGGLRGWKTELERASRSAFLTGKSGASEKHPNWKGPSLDFFTTESKLLALMEGTYDDRGPRAVQAPDVKPVDPHADDRARLRGYRPRGFWASSWGPRPEDPACRLAAPVLAEWRTINQVDVQAVTIVRESPEDRLRGMIAAFRRQKMWAKANSLEQQLAGLTGMAPVEVEAPPEDKPARAPARGPVTDVEAEWEGIPEGENFGGEDD